MYEQVKKQAETMLKRFSMESSPVNIERIVKELGIEIGYAPSAKYSGMLIRKSDGKVLMGINNSESTGRMRFTIAHELGHFILFPKENVNIDYRNKEYSSKKPKKEKIADFFAANLLMPESFVQMDFKQVTSDGIFFENNLIQLADKYKVSVEAMRYRLINLKLIPTDSANNIY